MHNPTAEGERGGAASAITGVLTRNREIGLALLVAIIVAGLAVARPDTFFTVNNLFNILKQVSLVTIVAVGQTFVIVSGGIDLSVGMSLGLSGVIASLLIQDGASPAAGIAVGILASVIVGGANGLITAKLRLPAFIVTLGMAKIARGVMYVTTRGYPIPTTTQAIVWLGNGYVGPVPVPTILMLVTVIAGTFVLTKTSFGNRVRAIGGNEIAARLSGVNVEGTKIAVYVLAALLSAIAGIAMVGRVNAGNPNSGLNFDMDSIAAAIIGGTSLAGGSGTIIGTLLGALMLGVLSNGLVLLNVNMYWQTIVAGTIILVVCIIDALSRRGRRKDAT
jgi:ribose/xylose/arabinose/galactoside ABC-type transport system permease subunit